MTVKNKSILSSYSFKLPDSAFFYPKLGYKVHGFEIGITSLCINILGLSISLITLQVYDRILIYQNISTLNLLCFGAIIAVIVESILKICRAYIICWSASSFEHTVSCNAVRHTLSQEADVTENVGIGEYLQRIGAIGKIRDFYSGQSLATLIDLPFIFIFLIIIAYLGGVLVFVPLFLIFIMGSVAVVLGKYLKNALIKRDKADDNRYEFMIHALSGVHTVKAFGLESAFERRYERWQSDTSKANFEVASFSASAYDQGIIASHAMMIIVAVVGAPMVLSGELALGALIACVMLSGRIMQPIQKALGFWTRLQDIEIARQKIIDHFVGDNFNDINSSIKNEKEGKIVLKNVSFSYQGQDKIIDSINLSLNPGDIISIAGDHGVGKQTLLKLIAGIYKPNEGDITVNGVNPQKFKSDELLENIGYLASVGTIFHGTIYENLSRFGRISEDRVREMASLLGLDQEIAALPAGYHTKLDGGNSDTIPPGLRQRIAIARILASKPRIILFYNADRALDKDGYNYVYRLLAKLKGRVTMILVSNDKNIMRLSNKTYQLNNGRLEVVDDNSTVNNYQEMNS